MNTVQLPQLEPRRAAAQGASTSTGSMLPIIEGIDAALHDVWQGVTEAVDLTGGDAGAADQQ